MPEYYQTQRIKMGFREDSEGSMDDKINHFNANIVSALDTLQ